MSAKDGGRSVSPDACSNKFLDSPSEDEGVAGSADPHKTHTVTFKCIGTTHDHNAQEILAAAKQCYTKQVVPVVIEPEPSNPYDSEAICFKCFFNDKWHRIGYVVREALIHVHKALSEKKILSLKFAWIKYLAIWNRSGPGFYAGIDISIEQEWHPVVVRCRSTR